MVRAGKGSFWGRAVGLFGSGVWGCARRLPWMQRVGETFSCHSEWGRGVCRGAGPGTDGGCVFPWFFPGGAGGGAGGFARLRSGPGPALIMVGYSSLWYN